MEKAELRKYIKQQKALHKTKMADAANVLKQLEQDEHFLAAQTILMYYSLPDEVDTHGFINKWCQEKQIVLPVVVGEELDLRHFTSANELRTGSFGIAEPTGDLFTDYNQIDVVIVPGIAFDQNGNRLGRGKGYYDRLLPKLSKAYKIGICFPYQLVAEVPTEPTDIQMDSVIC